jgi:hypothetical protein
MLYYTAMSSMKYGVSEREAIAARAFAAASAGASVIVLSEVTKLTEPAAH